MNLQNSSKNNQTFTEANCPAVESFQMSSECQILPFNIICSETLDRMHFLINQIPIVYKSVRKYLLSVR
jgi:hypothetical protein